MPLASILVVDPDTRVRQFIASELRERGHEVSESEDAGSALRAARQTVPDLMVCDFRLPDLDGIELLVDLRRNDDLRRIRVLMTSADEGVEDIVTALQSGADDFVGKPIAVPELVARVDACLRRPATIADATTISAGGISIDNIGHRVMVNDDYISLAPLEYRLLLFLLSNQDRVFSRRQLLVHVWDRNSSIGPRTVDVHIRRLRSALEPFGFDGCLQTVRGSGYRFSLEG